MNQPLITPCSRCTSNLNCWSGATECEFLERLTIPSGRIPVWGVEEMTHHIYVGPLRADGSGKLAEIAFSIPIFCITDAALKRHLANATMIAMAVNAWLRAEPAE
jgi:hypothetical protein